MDAVYGRGGHGSRDKRDAQDGRENHVMHEPKYEVRSSNHLELRTSNGHPSRSSRLSRAAILLGGWGRMDEVVGRQFRASQVGGQERLNLAAQCVLNFIRGFSGIDHFEVKLFRHFIELLDEK